jgi:hypothetical protein
MNTAQLTRRNVTCTYVIKQDNKYILKGSDGGV